MQVLKLYLAGKEKTSDCLKQQLNFVPSVTLVLGKIFFHYKSVPNFSIKMILEYYFKCCSVFWLSSHKQ